MSPKLSRLVASLALATAATLAATMTACGDDPSGPGPIAGRYTLRLVNGQPVPIIVSETRVSTAFGAQGTLREYFDGATLTLVEPEADTLRFARRSVITPDAGAAITTLGTQFTPFYLDDDRLCPNDAYVFYVLPGGCPGRPTVKRHGDSLFLQLVPAPATTGAEYVFVREGR